MTKENLVKYCENREFDRITVVVRDIFREIANLQTVFEILPDDVRIRTEKTDPGLRLPYGGTEYTEKSVSYYFANTELHIVQPVKGVTLYQKYLDRFGEGICCVREHMEEAGFCELDKELTEKGISIPQRCEGAEGKAFWADLSDELGILYEACTGTATPVAPERRRKERIAQVNITTADVQKTMEKVTDLLHIGPWEVGRQCNKVVDNPAFRVNGELKDVEFSFLLAILPCGNLEWEIIQPEKGPLVYNRFLEHRGTGFHHVLQEVQQKKWEEELQRFENNGIQLACRGTLGVVDWCYMDTEKELGFYLELRTDAKMEKLPDGYVQYFYPE